LIESAVSAYDEAFFDYVNTTARQSAERIVPTVNTAFAPQSVLDVGCGQGAWLKVWTGCGARDVVGVDGEYVDPARLLIPLQSFRAHDLKEGFDLGRRFDLVQCLEVAEHIPETHKDQLIDSLIRHGHVILFSAAPPGQGGHDHVNERSYEYWRQEFARRGYVALDYVRPQISADAGIASWYRYNLMLYVHQDVLPQLGPALRSSLIPEGTTVRDFAPFRYRLRRQLVRRLPVSMMTVIARIKERIIGRESKIETPEGKT
jgi:SAM-dependent methyltransferase